MVTESVVARYWISLDNSVVQCELCPHFCRVKSGNFGLCKTRFNNAGVLYATNYGKVVSLAYDPIEKKPLRQFYPGSTIFSIGTFGCNLTCAFCQNHELVHYTGPVEAMDDTKLLELAKGNDSIGIAYTYNEPTVWYEYVLDMSRKAHAIGLKNVLVTNGYINEAPLLELLPSIDAMNIDLKAMTHQFYKEICGGTLGPVLRAIELSSKQTHVEVTNLMIDGLNSNLEEVEAMAKWLASLSPDIPLHISRYFPAYKLDIPMTKLESLSAAKECALKYLKNVYIGNAIV